jgi:AraC-like DNA-binding protein
MDTLSDVLTHLRSSGALVGRTLVDPPWSARFEDGASLTLVTMLRGTAWIRDAGSTHELATRDIAVIVGPAPFTVASEPTASAPPLFIQTADGVCLDASGRPADDITLGVRTCGTQLDAGHALFTGSFTVTGRIADRLLDALPRIVLVPASAQRITTLDLLESELLRDEPGQQALLDRLLDLVLVETLRDWFALPTSDTPGWYAAGTDPVVGPALEAIHRSPALPWTVEALAARSHVSRATFARRFTAALGQPPMSYLAGWRLCLAADLLERSDATVETIARDVGYSSSYALSTAFHREYGRRPTRYRQSVRSGP